jgi:transcriptional regulator
MPIVPSDHLQGTLDLLILRALVSGPAHGWAVAERLKLVSRDVLQIGQGSLYPALYRLEERRWIKATWGVSELGRRARFYQLTTSGRRQLERERESWQAFVAAVGRVLQYA